MARNFAQIFFLVYGFVLLLISSGRIRMILKRKLGAKALRRRVRGGANAYLFLTVKSHLNPILYWLNLSAYCLVAFLALCHLTVGWFAFFALPLRILNAIALLLCGAEAYLLSVLANMMQFGEPFFLYRPDEDPTTNRAFASSVLDAVVYGVLPLVWVICNFTL
ncbi:MAG: hypothetical protein IKD18_01500 [Clostridia bacterium]|nr:hypothetical protein [Clostridia bacterium]